MAIPTDLSYHDRGFLLTVVEYDHLLRWNGAAWEFAPGDDGNAFFREFVAAPQSAGWVLCDGSTTDYLTLGAVLGATAITLPDETTDPVYHKSDTAYSGTVNAPTAPTLSGSTGAESTHTHGATSTPSATVAVQAGVGTTVATDTHTHTTSAGDSHSHSVGTLVNSADGEPRNLSVLRYFRR